MVNSLAVPSPLDLVKPVLAGAFGAAAGRPAMSEGRVARVFRWPAKGFGGEELMVGTLDRHGLEGDRRGYLTGANGRKVTAFGVPALLRWSARWEDRGIVVHAPDGADRHWDDPELAGALSSDLGRPVTVRDAPGGAPDVANTVLITVEATRRAVEAALGAPLDIRRFRPNLHVELDAPAFAEEAWVGRRFRIGDTELEGVEACDRCVVVTRDPETIAKWPDVLLWLTRERGGLFGLRARVVRPGTVAAGDNVAVRPRAPAPPRPPGTPRHRR